MTELTQKEKYDLLRQQKEAEKDSKLKKRNLLNKVLLIIPVLILLAGVGFGFKYIVPDKKADIVSGTPKIEMTPAEYDAGTVSMEDGVVKKVYTIKNIGEGSLKLDNIWTSCACTSAVLKIGEKVSPKFGMPGHGSNPTFWSEIINPGETGELEVVFDPMFHGHDANGPITRAIYVQSNDPQVKTAQVLLAANVIH